VTASSPTFAEWLGLSDRERTAIQTQWNTYGGEGEELVRSVSADFRAACGDIAGVEVVGPGIYHGGNWVIGVKHPFVFDRRKLPSYHLGISVHTSIGSELPPEFQDKTRKYGYIWAPPHYEQFVDRCSEEIRGTLRGPDMSREEMLSALVGQPFRDFVESCRCWVREGKISAFE
jgi:hypothetical protein